MLKIPELRFGDFLLPVFCDLTGVFWNLFAEKRKEIKVQFGDSDEGRNEIEGSELRFRGLSFGHSDTVLSRCHSELFEKDPVEVTHIAVSHGFTDLIYKQGRMLEKISGLSHTLVLKQFFEGFSGTVLDLTAEPRQIIVKLP